MRVGLETSFPGAMVAELAKLAAGARRYPEAVRASAIELQDRARAHASGRPGPNIITYQFWSAYTWALTGGGDEAIVGNGSAYANRLEYGFVGVDRLGRHYNQPPYPSLGPAVAESQDLLADKLREVIF